MKKNKFIIAMVLGLMTLATVTNAQNGRFSIGLEGALPMGDFADGSSFGYGGSLRYEYPVGDNLGLTGTAGYLMFGGKTVDGFEMGDWSMIPVQVGAKYYFTENQEGFYAAAELGIHSTSYKSPEYEIFGTTVPSETVTSTDFSYAPEVGYHLANLDLGLRYQFIASDGSTLSYLGFRIAYVLGEK